MSAAPAQIWIRAKGSRRQAFYRLDAQCPWQDMLVKHADKALRDGFMKLGSTKLPVVSRETSEVPAHPAAGAFHALARSLNRDIDAINHGRAA
jgi:hypothetical protein